MLRHLRQCTDNLLDLQWGIILIPYQVKVTYVAYLIDGAGTLEKRLLAYHLAKNAAQAPHVNTFCISA